MSILPKGWRREEVMRKSGLSTGKTEVYYVSPNGVKVKSKLQLQRSLGDAVDLTCFDFRTGKINPHLVRLVKHHRLRHDGRTGLRCGDISVSPPTRRTASIFKQPVTLVRTQQESKVKSELKHVPQDKPKQLFWEKRLEGLKPTINGLGDIEVGIGLPKTLVPVGPEVTSETALRSLSTALHLNSGPITGQNVKNLEKNLGIFLDPAQPLIATAMISDEDIRRQEDKVSHIRRKLANIINEYELVR